MKKPQIIYIKKEERIDKAISTNSSFSRNEAKKMILDHIIFVNDKLVLKPNFIVRPNSKIKITEFIEKEINVMPEPINLNIIYEDSDLVVINKPSGMVVHPAPGHANGTLVNGLLYHFSKLSNINGQIRPGIIHRIDKDTSGLLIVAKNNLSHQFLAKEIKNHNIKRFYLAWIQGRLENQITHIDLPIGRDPKNRKKMAIVEENSKNAITHVFVEKILDKKTLVRCELETGRTHQIRVHLAYIKHPIIGDPIYGKKVDDFGQQLHAYEIQFVHPTSKKYMKFKVDPPPFFLKN